jgi:hypothetical protein
VHWRFYTSGPSIRCREELPVQQLTTRMVAKIVRPDISPWVCCPN